MIKIGVGWLRNAKSQKCKQLGFPLDIQAALFLFQLRISF